MEIFKIFGSIFLKSDEADKSLDKVDKKAQTTGVNLGKIVGTAATVGAGIVAGVAAGGAAMLGLANKAAETADKWDKLSERTGIGVEALQKWGYAANQSGADISKLEVGMKTLSAQIVKAKEGNEDTAIAFDKLNLSLADLKELNNEDIFDEIMYSLATMPEGAERNVLGSQMLGKSYTELLPLLNSGSAGMTELKKRAVDLGIVMSEDAVDAGVVFGDTLADVKDSFGAIVAKIGIEVMPIMQKAMDWVLENMPTIQAVASKVFDAISFVVTKTVDIFNTYLLPALTDLWNWVQPYLPRIQAFFKNVFDAVGLVLKGFIKVIGDVINWVKQWFKDNKETVDSIKELFKAAFELIKTHITTFITVVQDLWAKYGDDIQRIAKTAWDYVGSIIKTAIDIITGIIKVFTAVLKGDWSGALDAIKQTAGKVWEDIKNVFDKYINMAKSIVGLGLDVIKNAFGKTFGGIKDTVGGIFEGIVTNIKNSINKIISNVNLFIKAINKLKIKIPEVDIPLKGKVGGNTIGFPKINEIPMLAKGGTIAEAGRVIVGEAGAELLDLPRGATVTPLSDDQKVLEGQIVINITGNTIMSDRDADRLGEIIVRRLNSLGVK